MTAIVLMAHTLHVLVTLAEAHRSLISIHSHLTPFLFLTGAEQYKVKYLIK